jgi:hypothetical protein
MLIPARNEREIARLRAQPGYEQRRQMLNRRLQVKRWALRYRGGAASAEDVPVDLRETVQVWLQAHPRQVWRH